VRDCRLEEEDGVSADVWAPLSTRREEEREVPVQAGFLGCGPDLELGQKVAPSQFLFFSFSFFLFLFSFYFFITFVFWLQFDSNQIVNFPKIEQNISEQ
jgi:hypothetical protein